MGSEELRLASFCDWPLTAPVRPEQLAAAGFFHAGQRDEVRCFFCGGGLQSWEPGDDPWTEHATWFPRCEFLLRTKGRDFACHVRGPIAACWAPGTDGRNLLPRPQGPLSPSVPHGPQLLSPPAPRGGTHSEGAREPGAQDAEEQLRRLREERTWKVCWDRLVSVIFVPCGHLVCAVCAPSLQRCPICRTPVRSCLRTFLP